ncbi:hypothetical protein [Zobellella aerophila]|uniref:MSHA biogenesis protein MshK n=1 Tax=Zobellella aerophila TaxID=870480 RepID=A0ABP6V812_9GAMM
MVNPLVLLMLGSAPLLQDPTRPLNLEPEPRSPSVIETGVRQPFRLQAVMHNGRDASAIIDDQRYRLGDRIGGYRLAAIGRRQVRLEAQGESLELRLFSPLISQGVQ